ncbi:hypothetical protein F5B19DRAFT_498813 [Rostrohypoxylon terebratum]|nr:hypothetical protein F5B19DRAFT_498813 [Rostrohypoxylon terebratum]
MFQTPISKAVIAELPNPPQYDEELHEWATYMARQLALHIANQPHSKPPHTVKAIAWELPGDKFEAKLGHNPMKMVNETTITSGILDGIVKVMTKWSKNGNPITIGAGTLIEPNVVVRENDIGMIRLNRSFQGVHPIDYVQTPFTDSLSGRTMLGSIYGFPSGFPNICVSEMRVKFSLTRDPGWAEHNGDTKEGNSGGPVMDMNGRLVAIHGGWEWANKKQTEKINVSAPVNRMGNDVDVFREIIAFMAVNSGNLLRVGAKFLAPKSGGITEVAISRRYAEQVPKIVFEWH